MLWLSVAHGRNARHQTSDEIALAVDILAAQETSHSPQETQFKQSGLTVAVTAQIIAAIQTAEQMRRAAGETSDTRMKALAGATALRSSWRIL